MLASLMFSCARTKLIGRPLATSVNHVKAFAVSGRSLPSWSPCSISLTRGARRRLASATCLRSFLHSGMTQTSIGLKNAGTWCRIMAETNVETVWSLEIRTQSYDTSPVLANCPLGMQTRPYLIPRKVDASKDSCDDTGSDVYNYLLNLKGSPLVLTITKPLANAIIRFLYYRLKNQTKVLDQLVYDIYDQEVFTAAF